MATMTSKKRTDDEEAFPWAELPSEVQSSVLGWLPLRHLFRSKLVCKLWNSTISSPSFIHFPSYRSCSDNSPWLIFFSPKSFDFLLAFDFDAFSWFKFDVSFLSSMLNETNVRTSSSPPSAERGFVWCTGTASGLLLLDFRSSLHVCNPVTKSFLKLPPFKCIEVIFTQGFSTSHIRGIFTPAKTSDSMPLHHRLGYALTPGISSNISISINAVQGFLTCTHIGSNLTERHFCATKKKGKVEGTSQDMDSCLCSHDYTVVAIGKAKRELVIEAYCLSRNSWEIVGSMPTSFIIRHEQMMECNGLFYSLLLEPLGMLVVGESSDGGTPNWRIQAMPVNYGNEARRLLACQNSIFMLCPADVHNNGFVIWRYQTGSRSWIKLQDMPEYILEDVRGISNSNWIDCVGVGNFICFRALGTLSVLTYNLCNEIWSWLPEPLHEYETVFARGLQFEPRLDCTQSL